MANKTYQVEFIFSQYEELEVPAKAEFFTVNACNIEDAVKEADKKIHYFGLTDRLNDYELSDCNDDSISCDVDFTDGIAGMMLRYEICEA